MQQFSHQGMGCVCVRVCVREREREGERDRDRGRESQFTVLIRELLKQTWAPKAHSAKPPSVGRVSGLGGNSAA